MDRCTLGIASRQMRQSYNAWSLVIFLIMLLTTAGGVSASDDDRVSFSGFGTIGVTKGGNDELAYRRAYSQFGDFGDWQLKTDSLLGVQFDARINSQLSFTMQLVAKDRVKNNLDRSISWAFLKYSPTPHVDIHLGRLALDLYNLSEYRDLGFGYLWARPPVEFYMPVAVNSFDGADIRYQYRLGPGVVEAKLFAGRAKDRIASSVNNFDFKLNPVYGFNISYAKGSWRSRLTIATSKINDIENPLIDLLNVIETVPVSYWPEAEEVARSFETVGRRLSYYSAGTVYDTGAWLAQAEVARVESSYKAAPAYTASYISVGRRVTSNLMLHTMFSRVKTTDAIYDTPGSEQVKNGPLKPLIDITNFALNSSRVDQKAISVGLRWDLTTRIAMKVQWDHIKLGTYAVGLWLYDGDKTKFHGEVDTFTMTLDFVF